MSTYTIEYLTGKSTDELYRSVSKENCGKEEEKNDKIFPCSFPDISFIYGRNDADWSHLSSSPFETSTGSSPSLLFETSPSSCGSPLLSFSSTNSSISEERSATKKEESSPKDKPAHSYIALISMAILKSPEKKLLLGDIYEYIMTTFPYYNNKEKAWRNSIRHNLSLNECFIKSGRADNGKGNYWSIHPACVEDFSCGDFRRRQARRRARKNITQGRNVNDLCNNYSSNFGYVPMTSSTLPYSTTTPCYPRTNFTSYQMTPSFGSSLSKLSSSLQFSDVSNFYRNRLNIVPQNYLQLY